MRHTKRRRVILVWCVFSMTVTTLACGLGGEREDWPTMTPAPRATPWWPTPSYQPWPTATPEGG